MKSGKEIMGIGGLELHGSSGLLRSLIIRAEHRGKGAGRKLVQELSEEARRLGLQDLWLLTETAEPFFSTLGFQPRAREEAPNAIQSSAEFSALCPDSAICMSIILSTDS